MAEAGMKVWIEDKEYDFDDFELGELEWLEDELGSLEDDKLASMKAMVRFVYIIKRRDNPEFSLDEARKLKLNVFSEPPPRPTKAPRGAAKKPAPQAA